MKPERFVLVVIKARPTASGVKEGVGGVARHSSLTSGACGGMTVQQGSGVTLWRFLLGAERLP
jgi:hypothetical protein